MKQNKQKKKIKIALFTGFPFRCRFLIPQGQSSVFFDDTQVFTVPHSPLGLSEFSNTLQKFPEMNPVTGYGRILKCLLTGQKELQSSCSCRFVCFFFFLLHHSASPMALEKTQSLPFRFMIPSFRWNFHLFLLL